MPPSREPLRSIHAGVGGRGRTHLQAAIAAGYWRPVALVDPDPEALRLARSVAALPETACFARLEDALDAVPAEAVAVTSSPAAHAALIMTALAAGKHVLTEKAFTVGLADALRCVAEAARRDRKLMVVQNARLYPHARTFRRLVAEQRYGPLGFFHMTFYKSRGAPYGHPGARIGQMHLWEQAVHELDTILSVVQQPVERVWARSFNPVWCDWPSESTALVIADFARGASGAYVATSNARADGFDFRLECAEAAIVSADRRTPFIRILFGPQQRHEELIPVDTPDVRGFEHHPYAQAALAGDLGLDGQHVDTLANMRIYRDFFDYIVDGVEPESSGRRNLETIRFVEAAQRSSETGRPVRPAELEA
jgi:predicted dehydrogenase